MSTLQLVRKLQTWFLESHLTCFKGFKLLSNSLPFQHFKDTIHLLIKVLKKC